MVDILLDALIDSAKMMPLLLMIYITIELIEYKFGDKIRQKIQKSGKAGPAIGALAGSFPQCGFSVVSTALYTQRLLTIGTLLAVYLSTSDEAIPVILSQPDKAGILLPLIATKIIIAVIAGYSIDFVFRRMNRKTLHHAAAYAQGRDEASHHHESVIEEHACCGHFPSASAKKFNPREIIIHPFIHTIKVFFFIFIISLFIGIFISQIGIDRLQALFSNHLFLQPFLTAIIGLIPNCASSVAITELYIQGTITYGAMISGLCAGGGLGLVVLAKEEKNRSNILMIISLLLTISIVAGLAIQYGNFFN